MPKVAYLVSSCLDYDLLICGDAGPSVAHEYGWSLARREDLDLHRFDAVIIDNRHHDATELIRLRALILDRPSQLFLLRVVDPCLHHQRDNWYIFLREMLDRPNVHFITPYTLTGFSALLSSLNPRKWFIHSPYTYDCGQELPIEHISRRSGILVSGARSSIMYPIRFGAQRIAAALPSSITGFYLLGHPGYLDISQKRKHNTIGKSFTKYIAGYTAAFSCSSTYRMELMKFREIAYAGCIPVGDLPFSLVDCALNAHLPWRRNWIALGQLVRKLCAEESEFRARSFRRFFREKRDRKVLMERVNGLIMELAGSI